MEKLRGWKVVGKVNGVEIRKDYDYEHTADAAAKTLNDIFAPFTVEEIIEEKVEPIKVEAKNADGVPF